MEALRERFGKYHVLEKIAQGGMAEVYKVKTVGIAGFEKIQALKRILPSAAREGRFIRSFIDEARIAVELTHRNIVQVFDFGKADGELFMAMELIEGRDLRTALIHALDRDEMPPIPVAAYIIGEAAAGLDYAHRKTDGYGGELGIVHCDVSPSNIMLSNDGYVKILDFGIARASFATALERRRLRGKPRYMAPEQTYGEQPTAASDVFALGIIAWEVFTGLPLFRGPNLKEILKTVRSTIPARVDELDPRIPRELADAIAKALSREPSDRGSSGELAGACARATMGVGARALQGWLAKIQPIEDDDDERDNDSEVAANDDPREDRQARIRTATMRPNTRGSAPSLANVPLADADLGEGTPGFAEIIIEDDPPAASGRLPRLETEPARQWSGPPRFGDRDPTMGTQGPWAESYAGNAFDSREPTARSETARDVGFGFDFEHREPTVPSEPATFHREPTPVDFQDREATVPSELFSRASYQRLHFQAPGVAAVPEPAPLPASDSDHQSEDTRFDDVELDPALDGLFDEPIDDDLGASGARGVIERRRAIVISATLAGPSAAELRPIARSIGELAYQRGGVVLAQTDDALQAAFGLEVAGEDDLSIAMGWALDATAIARDVRVGADRSSVIVRIGAVASVSITADADGVMRVPAEVTEQARALARDASPGLPRFLGMAGRLASSFYQLRDLYDPLATRSNAATRLVEVVGQRGFDERDRARLARRGVFAGRAAELSELAAWLQRAVAADRRLVTLVTGAPGTGKSRLAAELVARLTAENTPLRITTTAANPAHRLAPFSLIIDLYQAALGLPPSRGRAARLQVMQQLSKKLIAAGAPADRARTIAIDLDRAMELRDGVGVGAPEIADLRPRISAGLAAFRATLFARGQPQLTIIDDLHDADSASLEVLRHTLAVPATGAELMVLTTSQDTKIAPPSDAVIRIGDLARTDARAMIMDRLGAAATPTNVSAVLARAGGNPLFIEELAQAVSAGGQVPATARDVIAARLDRLSPAARTALRYAAVFGATIRTRLLEELVADAPNARRGAADNDGLDELVSAGLLGRADADAGREGELAFARGLIREVAYESMSPAAQREMHARIGRLLASRFFAGREELPATIAEHLELGGELAGAAAFWLRAGRLAMTASDVATAIGWFSRTIALERRLGAAPPSSASLARRREALASREEAHRALGDFVSDAGDLEELQRLADGDPVRLADIAIRRAHRMLRFGDYANASITTLVAEDHATAAANDRLHAEALRVRSEILERLGRFDEALVLVGRAAELFRKRGAVEGEMAALLGRGRIHLMRAHYEAAREAYRPVLARLDATSEPWLARIAHNHTALIEMCLGNFTEAMAAAERSRELCRRYGDRTREGEALGVAGLILHEVGLYDRAAERFAAAIDLLGRTASKWSRADCLIYAGACDVRRGRSSGLQMLDEALAEARGLGARYLEANALIRRAGAQLRRSAFADAAEDAAAGTAIARAAGLVGYEIQGLARSALALTRLGKTDDAVAHANRSLELLERQRYVEGSEEDVLAACAQVLRAAGDTERANQVRERGRASAQRKLDALVDPEWRAAFAAVSEVRQLLG
ncbi:MAG: serine/threonine-protein kinase PknK [Kofleriaceae bacterium]